MPRYLAKRDTLISHESRLIKAGDEFEATFPEGMKLGENLELLPEKKNGKADDKKNGKADDKKADDKKADGGADLV